MNTQADDADNEYAMIDKGGCPCPSTQRGCKRGDASIEAIGRSSGRIKYQDSCCGGWAGQPTQFPLDTWAACDLDGADQLLPNIIADTVLADKGYDADERVIERLQAQGKTALIPPKRNYNNPRDYNRDLYQARHLIEIFFAFLKQYRAITTRYDKRAANFLGAIYLATSVIWLN